MWEIGCRRWGPIGYMYVCDGPLSWVLDVGVMGLIGVDLPVSNFCCYDADRTLRGVGCMGEWRLEILIGFDGPFGLVPFGWSR
jgi:hypothetical protein